MRITEAWQQWLTEHEWEDKPEIDEEEQTSTTRFGITLNEISATCFVEIAEKAGYFKLYAYPEIEVDESKIGDLLKKIADDNKSKQVLGSLQLLQGEESKLRYYAGIDVDDAPISTQLIQNVLSDLSRVFERWLPEYLPSDEAEVSTEGTTGVACVACNAALKGGEKFCPECGVAQQRECGKCQTKMPGNAKFCPECGAPTAQ